MTRRIVQKLILVALLLQASQSNSFSEPSSPAETERETPLVAIPVDRPACQHLRRNEGDSTIQHLSFRGTALKISESIRGYEVHDYVFFGVKGSRLSVSFSSRYAFPILFQENTIDLDANEAPYIIPETRCYRLRVMMMRAVARRGIVSPYRMTLNVMRPRAIQFGDFAK